MRDEVILICKRCFKQARVKADEQISGKSPKEWFADRHELCQDCYIALVKPKIKIHKNARDTSKSAGLLAYPKSGTKRAMVLEAIKQQPMTDEEIQQVLNMSQNTQRPRRVELVEGGFIRDSKQRRKTVSGTHAIVWEATGDY